jgi:hypothetical protein
MNRLFHDLILPLAEARVTIGDRQESELTGAFDFALKNALLFAVQAVHARRDDSSAFGNERLEGFDVLIVED